MDSKNTPAKKETKEATALVRVIPVETEKGVKDKSGEKKSMSMHWQADKAGRFFAENLTAQQLKPALVKARVKLENLLLKDEGDFIVYMYKARPLIKLNTKEGQFYAPTSTMAEFDKEAIQQQAHIVLDILKTNGLSNAQRGKETLQSNARTLLSKLKTYKE